MDDQIKHKLRLVLRSYIWPCVAFASTLAFLPFGLVISLTFRIYRHSLRDLVRSTLKGNDMLVDHDDSMWCTESPQNRALINAAFLLKGTPDIEVWRKTLLKRMITMKNEAGRQMFPKFTKYIAYRYTRPIWVEEEHFDIADHVKLWTEFTPRTTAELEILLGKISSSPVPPMRSPWQIILVPTPDHDEPHFTMLLRIHHAIGDGISLSKMIMNYIVDVKPTAQRSARFASKNKTQRIIKAIFEGPALTLERLFWPDDHHILHGKPLSGDKRLAWSNRIDLDFIKRIKNTAQCTVNDVLTSCLSGAFHDYFKRHSCTIPKDITAFVPVDLRSPKKELVLDNQFSVVFFQMPTGSADSISLLHQTKARMNAIKTSAEPIVNGLTVTYSLARFPEFISRFTLDSMSNKCTLVLSNVPGPSETLTMCGDPIVDMVFWPPSRAKSGITVSLLSYNGFVKMGVFVDRVLMSNPSELVELFESRIQDLAKTLDVSPEQ